MKKVLCGFLIVLITMLASPRDADSCNVCHSKNPKMLKMHEELKGKGCFQCHNFQKRNSSEEVRQRKADDPLCTPCHKK